MSTLVTVVLVVLGVGVGFFLLKKVLGLAATVLVGIVGVASCEWDWPWSCWAEVMLRFPGGLVEVGRGVKMMGSWVWGLVECVVLPVGDRGIDSLWGGAENFRR